MSVELQRGDRGEGWRRRVRCAGLRDHRQRTPVRRSDRSLGQDARSACSGSCDAGGPCLPIRGAAHDREGHPLKEHSQSMPRALTSRLIAEPNPQWRDLYDVIPRLVAVTRSHDSWLRCAFPPSPRRSLSRTLEGTWSPAPEHTSCAMPIVAWGAGRPATRCVEPDPVATPPGEGG